MPICLDKADGRVRAVVSGVETEMRNGYKIVWNLLFRYVPGFDPTKTVDKPRWDLHEGDVIQYAAAFDLYFRLSAKRGNTHSQFNKSILFLKGITARNLMKIVEPLIIAIKGIKIDAEFAPSMIYVTNEDKPGFIGRFAGVLGEAAVNIATFALGRDAPGGSAIALVQIDGETPAGTIEKIQAIPGVKQAKVPARSMRSTAAK